MEFLNYLVGFCLVCLATSDVLYFQQDPVEDVQELSEFLMKPSVPSRYMNPEEYSKWGVDIANPVTEFNYKNCGNASNEMAILLSLDITPDPITLPGTVKIVFTVNITEPISSIAMDVVIKKKVFGTYVTLPCIDNFGSCSYADFCSVISGITCPSVFDSHHIPCKCPFGKGLYSLPNGYSFDVDVPFLPSGDYFASANMTSNGKPVGCYEIVATFA